MPPDDASDAEWVAWADLQELQAILAGLISRGGEIPTVQADEQWHQIVSAHLTSPAVIALLGDAVHDARALAAAFGMPRLSG